ncbi:cyclase family protein [bacterium]|nr:cyclase family protein [bacterium]MBP9808737.1 cyclase family protein [bacterium]
MNFSFKNILDISQPVNEKSACFPGDTPFSRKVTLSYESSNIINLTALTMSPHVGTHADAPVHIKGSLCGADHCSSTNTTAGAMNLQPFVGPVAVIDIAPTKAGINAALVQAKLTAASTRVKRVLFKTAHTINFEVFEDEYSYIESDTAELLGQLGFILVGLDTPSVDHIRSKDLATHNVLDRSGLVWLENLDLRAVDEGEYFLVALPLKFMDLEASPVRAVLLT